MNVSLYPAFLVFFNPNRKRSDPSSSSSVSSDIITSSSVITSSSIPISTSDTTIVSSSSIISSSSDTTASSAPLTSPTSPTSSIPTISPTTTGPTGPSIVTFTSTQSITESANTPSETAAVRAATNKGFFQNKAAVGATFAIVGLVVVGIIFALITNSLRRRRARRFDREIAEEAKRAPAPVFLDDDDDYAHGAMGGGYSTYGGAAAHADPYAAHPADPYAAHAVSSEGTPSNYMYPSGYSDLGFSDVSSHGTYSQQPMDGQYNATGGGGGYGNYEMTGYGAAGHMPGYGAPQQQQEWAGHAQQAYVYPGEEQPHGGYPPAPTATTTSSDSGPLGRSKSAGGARSLVDAYSSPPVEPAKHTMPQYADGYVAQYQTPHVVEEGDDAYGGVESMHGHVEYDYEAEEEAAHGGPRVLKVANE
ncbi:hypothetical protein C8F01DRAFT_1246286 [Mycena amicta]|nr:hypothetical protein C8F01DRAFT_1246286 [Mycena amicta]